MIEIRWKLNFFQIRTMGEMMGSFETIASLSFWWYNCVVGNIGKQNKAVDCPIQELADIVCMRSYICLNSNRDLTDVKQDNSNYIVSFCKFNVLSNRNNDKKLETVEKTKKFAFASSLLFVLSSLGSTLQACEWRCITVLIQPSQNNGINCVCLFAILFLFFYPRIVFCKDEQWTSTQCRKWVQRWWL